MNSLDGWTIQTGYPKHHARKSNKHNAEFLRRFSKYKLYGYSDLKNKTLIVHPHYWKVMTDKERDDLLLHEVAHAITNQGHTKKWKQVFKELGGSGKVSSDLDYYTNKLQEKCI